MVGFFYLEPFFGSLTVFPSLSLPFSSRMIKNTLKCKRKLGISPSLAEVPALYASIMK